MTFNATRQAIHFNQIDESEKFHIKDDLLFDCIGLGCGSSRKENRVQGFNSGKAAGYALLTYFASQALGFRRFPLCEDRIYHGYFGDTELKKIVSTLDSSRIKAITEEVKSLYDHTQKALLTANLQNINVKREIKSAQSSGGYSDGYAETLVKISSAAHLLGKSEINVEMDTLNSFGDEGAYASPVQIELTVPASDVLYFSAIIGDRDGKPETMESGEWVLVNRSETGVVSLPASSVKYEPNMWTFNGHHDMESAQAFMDNHDPFILRPIIGFEPTLNRSGIKPSFRNRTREWLLRMALKYATKIV